MAHLTHLLRSPEKWTSEQFRILKLVQHSETVAAEIIDRRYLPEDGDEGAFGTYL